MKTIFLIEGESNSFDPSTRYTWPVAVVKNYEAANSIVYRITAELAKCKLSLDIHDHNRIVQPRAALIKHFLDLGFPLTTIPYFSHLSDLTFRVRSVELL